jgi:hypothetical protein
VPIFRLVRAFHILIAATLLTVASEATAQPIVIATARPAPNGKGWFNGPVWVKFDCLRTDGCPESRMVVTEGRGQRVEGTVLDAAGTQVSASLDLNIDRTAPAVEIRSPADGLATTASSIRVIAHVSDALSGVASATCNGREAHDDGSGAILCVVSLMPGVNDIVVEASDQANNSGSAGIRITRTGASSSLQVEPEAFSLLVGQSKQMRVLDDFHADVQDVVWIISNPAAGEISDDGRNTFTAKAAGAVTITAIRGGGSAQCEITIYSGDKLPPWALRWRNSGLQVTETPESGARTSNPVEEHMQLVAASPARRGLVTSINAATGGIDWIGTPAVNDSEMVTTLRAHTIGGSLLVIEPRDGTGSALARSGPPGSGKPWRYRSPGRLGDWIVQDRGGGFAIVETRPDRFPELVFFDGRTGRVTARGGFGRGVGVGLNIGCINGVNAVRDLPAEIGPTSIQPDGRIAFEMVRIDDLEDFQQCDRVSGRLRRVIELMTITMAGPNVQPLRVYEAPAGSAPPAITLFPVTSDGHGGLLAPWRANLSGGAVDSKIMHVTESDPQEYTLPAVGPVFVGAKDLAVATDGATIVSFNVMSGEIKHEQFFPEKGVRILSNKDGTVMFVHGDKPGAFDQYGRPLPPK